LLYEEDGNCYLAGQMLLAPGGKLVANFAKKSHRRCCPERCRPVNSWLSLVDINHLHISHHK